MQHYVGLDVSQKTTVICVVDGGGRRLWRGVCPTDPEQVGPGLCRAGVGTPAPPACMLVVQRKSICGPRVIAVWR